MSRLPVLSCGPNGYSDPVYIDSLGTVSALSLVHGANGPQACSWTLDVPEGFNHRALYPGRWIYVVCGASYVWSGQLTEPQRGQPWSCSADGLAAQATHFQAYAPSSGNSLALNEVVDEAIALGLLATRPASLPSLTEDTDTSSGGTTLDSALSTVAEANGQQWFVDPRTYALTMTAPPAAASLLLLATDPAGGRSLQAYVDQLVVRYRDSTSLTEKTLLVQNAAAVAKFGPWQDELDLTDQDYMSAAAATAQGTAHLATVSPRSSYTGTFSVTYGQVLTLGGVPVDLATLDCRQRVRVMQVDPDRAGELDLTTPTEILLGEVDYDVDSDTAQVTPLDSVPSGVVLPNGRVSVPA